MAGKGLKPVVAIICPLLAAGVVYAAGAVRVKKAEETYRQNEQTMPQVQLEEQYALEDILQKTLQVQEH